MGRAWARRQVLEHTQSVFVLTEQLQCLWIPASYSAVGAVLGPRGEPRLRLFAKGNQTQVWPFEALRSDKCWPNAREKVAMAAAASMSAPVDCLGRVPRHGATKGKPPPSLLLR